MKYQSKVIIVCCCMISIIFIGIGCKPKQSRRYVPMGKDPEYGRPLLLDTITGELWVLENKPARKKEFPNKNAEIDYYDNLARQYEAAKKEGRPLPVIKEETEQLCWTRYAPPIGEQAK